MLAKNILPSGYLELNKLLQTQFLKELVSLKHIIRGIAVWKSKFYVFTEKGEYKKNHTLSLRNSAVDNKNIEQLKAFIGGFKRNYYNSCLGERYDDVWKYENSKVFTFKSTEEPEVFLGSE